MRVNVASADAADAPSDAGRSKLQVQCANGAVLDVSHEEAMMSSTLWTLLQDVAPAARTKQRSTPAARARRHMIPVFDVPSGTVELALAYCRCLYQQQVERADGAMRAWEEHFFELDSKTLCDLAKVASNLDIQPLVDLTCRSIAQIMSATEAADELRHKFGLDDPPPNDVPCNCPEHRSDAAGFDFDVFNALDHDISTDEYEFVELEQPSVDELVDFINGDAAHPTKSRKSKSGSGSNIGSTDAASEQGDAAAGAPGSSGKKKKRKKKKKKSPPTSQQQIGDAVEEDEDEATASGTAAEDDGPASARTGSSDDSSEGELEFEFNPKSSGGRRRSESKAAELRAKMRLARQNPSAVFQESQFEDDSDEELDEQLATFRLALESAYAEAKKATRKPRLEFAPRDVFRSARSATATT